MDNILKPEIIQCHKTEYIKQLLIRGPERYEDGLDVDKYIDSNKLKVSYEKLVVMEKIDNNVPHDEIEAEHKLFLCDNYGKINSYTSRATKRRF